MRVTGKDDLSVLHQRGPGSHWYRFHFDDNTIHLIPLEDLLMHTKDDCICFPDVEELTAGLFVYTHNAWDGRK